MMPPDSKLKLFEKVRLVALRNGVGLLSAELVLPVAEAIKAVEAWKVFPDIDHIIVHYCWDDSIDLGADQKPLLTKRWRCEHHVRESFGWRVFNEEDLREAAGVTRGGATKYEQEQLDAAIENSLRMRRLGEMFKPAEEPQGAPTGPLS